MLLPDNVHPENTLFFNGAMIIRTLRILGEANLLDLLAECRKQVDLPMPLFVLSIDWLYLAGRVERNDTGNFVLCS